MLIVWFYFISIVEQMTLRDLIICMTLYYYTHLFEMCSHFSPIPTTVYNGMEDSLNNCDYDNYVQIFIIKDEICCKLL